jgi:hypothetical protein
LLVRVRPGNNGGLALVDPPTLWYCNRSIQLRVWNKGFLRSMCIPASGLYSSVAIPSQFTPPALPPTFEIVTMRSFSEMVSLPSSQSVPAAAPPGYRRVHTLLAASHTGVPVAVSGLWPLHHEGGQDKSKATAPAGTGSGFRPLAPAGHGLAGPVPRTQAHQPAPGPGPHRTNLKAAQVGGGGSVAPQAHVPRVSTLMDALAPKPRSYRDVLVQPKPLVSASGLPRSAVPQSASVSPSPVP